MRWFQNLRLYHYVLVSIALGIAAGIFFGDLCSSLRWVGKIYIMLVEAAVFPYIIASLWHSLGKLAPVISGMLFRRWLWVYGLLIIMALVVIVILSLAIPIEIVQSIGTVEPGTVGASGLLNLLIPKNIIKAIAHGYVPAVVVFIVLFGIATQTVRRKEAFLDLLATISRIALSFWGILVRLAPLAVFCLLASTVGTVQPNQLTSLAAYIILFYLGAILLTLWLIPAVITSLVPVSYRHLVSELRDALLISTATTVSVLAIPYIQRFTNKLLKEVNVHAKESEEITESTVMISYPFAQVGNYFILLFILFAAFYFQHSIYRLHFLALPFVTVLSSIGTPSTTLFSVNFMVHWLHIPSQAQSLYASILAITQYPQILVSVMGVSMLTIVTTLSVYKKLQFNSIKFLMNLGLGLFVAIVLSYGIHLVIPNLTQLAYQKLDGFSIDPSLKQGLEVTVIPFSRVNKIPARPFIEDSLYAITSKRTLRVGYNPTAIPFAFINDRGELVGFDIAYAYALAQSLHATRIVFVPFSWTKVTEDLKENKFDIAMAGAYVTPTRLAKAALTEPYLRSPVGLIVLKANKSSYGSVAAMQNIKHFTIGADVPLAPYAKKMFPNARVIIAPSISLIGKAVLSRKVNVGITSSIQGKLWTIQHPAYTVIHPSGLEKPILLAYLLNRKSPLFLNYVNYWLNLKKTDGFKTKTYDRWILVKPLKTRERWSVIRNVLHWVP